MLGTALSQRTLRRHGARIAVPGYDRRALAPAVVHVGVGAFHRSHQAVYLDRLARLGHTGWGLTGVGLRSRAMADALTPQDGLYTVVERGPRFDRPRVVGVLGRYLHAPDDPARAVAALAAARTRLVTLTITAAGYEQGPAPALLVAALARRRLAGRAPFTVLSCDNLPANGEAARHAVVSLAGRRDPGLARWIERHVPFPDSMVDRITPQTTDADRRLLAAQTGVLDRAPVLTEPFSDWVVEDAFGEGDRPPLDEVGVRFVDDVRPSALAKTRLLNASHLVLGALGRAAGLATMSEVMADGAFRAYAASLMHEEIVPSLPPTGTDLDDYARATLGRLANPRLADPLARLCRDAPAKLARHVAPSVLAARDDGRAHPLLTVAVAGVCVELRGERPVRGLLADRAVVGALAGDERFAAEVLATVRAIDRAGPRAAVLDALAAERLVAA